MDICLTSGLAIGVNMGGVGVDVKLGLGGCVVPFVYHRALTTRSVYGVGY